MAKPGHGAIGSREHPLHEAASRESPFTHMLELRKNPFPVDQLVTLAAAMKGSVDTVKDGPDPEENLWVPSGYTYFGQFIDHDLTFDSTSSLNPADVSADPTRQPSNLRTPRLDLDCVYGDGPDAQPFMYGDDGATLLYGGMSHPTQETNPNGLIAIETASWDLLRAPNGKAIIGDKRNDENSIICQIHLGFIKYHNAVVQRLKDEDPQTWNVPRQVFESARNEVRWTYQRLILEDFLPRIIQADVLKDLQDKQTWEDRKDSYALYLPEYRANLPREFVVAAYRFGHSGVRTGYRLNAQTRLSIFPSSDDTNQSDDSLVGFDPLPRHHVIDDWGRFFPLTRPDHDIEAADRVAAGDAPDPAVRLQFAYKLDPTLADPLGVLPPSVAGAATAQAKNAISPATLPNPDRPSLALLNLLRGNAYKVASGQAVADRLKERGKPVERLTAHNLVIRSPTDQDPEAEKAFQWTSIDPTFYDDTPLWFYVLAEAQAPVVEKIASDKNRIFLETELLNGAGARTQLGWVGGRIVAEVIYGLLDEDKESFVRHDAARHWKPRLANDGALRVRNLLEFR